MHISLSRSSHVQARVLMIAGILAAIAITLSVAPTLGLGAHQHYLLYLVATGQISAPAFVTSVLNLIPGWVFLAVGKDGVIASLEWIYGWVASEGIAAIGEAIAALSATGIGGLIVAAVGAATLG